ncbi:MAG: hypothetical protein AAF943_11000 [Pseudomonadota bacterium]
MAGERRISRLKRSYWALIALAGVAIYVEWRTCVFGLEMELFDTHYACRGTERVAVPLDYEAVGINREGDLHERPTD